MVGSSAANSDSFRVTTPSDQEIRMTRPVLAVAEREDLGALFAFPNIPTRTPK